MNCQTTQKLIQDYLDGRLAILDRNEFVRHTSMCVECEQEVMQYREVFSGLRDLPRFDAPTRVSNAVIAHLKSDGRIFEPVQPLPRRILNRFLGLPAPAKYPLAAATVVAALYLPIAALLGLARGGVTTVTGALTGAFVAVSNAVGGLSQLDGFFETTSSYGRALKSVVAAVTSLATSAGESAWPLGIGVAVALAAILVFARVSRRKRSSHHASSFSL